MQARLESLRHALTCARAPADGFSDETEVLASLVGLTVVASGFVAAPSGASDVFSGDQLWNQQWEILDGWNRSSSPVIADIDGVAGNEVVLAPRMASCRPTTGMAHAVDYGGHPGVALAATLRTPRRRSIRARRSPTSTGMVSPKVIVGVGSTWAPNQEWLGPRVMAVTATFSGRPTTHVTPARSGPIPPRSTAGVKQYHPRNRRCRWRRVRRRRLRGWDFMIWAVDRFGEPLPGFRSNNDDTIWSSQRCSISMTTAGRRSSSAVTVRPVASSIAPAA